MESSGARPEHGPDKGHRGRCTRRQGISRPGSLSLSFSLLSSPLLFTSLHFSSLLQRIHTHNTQHTQVARCTVLFRSVPFRSVPYRSFVPNERILCRFSPHPSSHLASPRLTSPRLVFLSSAHPIPSLARSLSWLRQPRYALLPQTQPRFNPDFVSNKRWIRWVYTPGCTRKVISSLFLLCDARRNEHFSRNAHAFRLGSANGQLATLV